jgi:perosamine synthetase
VITAPERILVAGPSVDERDARYVANAAMTMNGPSAYVWQACFERIVADCVGRDFAVATPNCTMALTLALAALGIGPGDEVIVPDVTWIGSVAPIVHLGATPILVDIRHDTWCIDVDAARRAISSRTKAIIGVDLYGGMCDWGDLNRLCFFEHPNIALIEDAAEAIGSRDHQGAAGTFGVASVFSFHGTKTVSTGEGGMVLTDDRDLYNRLCILRDHGRPPGDKRYEFDEFGYKARISAVTAALGVAQMERVDELVAKKRQNFEWYKQRLGGLGQMNAEPAGTLNSYWMTTIVPDGPMDKFAIVDAMSERNIDVRPFFGRLSESRAFRGRPESCRHVSRDGHWPVTWSEPWKQGVNLPSGHNLTEADVDLVCRALREVLVLALPMTA